jgi:hypothetical protein
MGAAVNAPAAERFRALQARLAGFWPDLLADRLAPRSILVLPSLSFDSDILGHVAGAHHYEERMLSQLMLLRLPRTELVFVTSTAIPPDIIDYYLHLLPGIPTAHARARLRLFSCDDASPRPLTAKILERPRLLARLKDAIRFPATAHMSAFTVTDLERQLAIALDLPIFGCDPDLLPLGSKSGSRRTFRTAGVPLPDGAEDLPDLDAAADALVALRGRQPGLRKAVVKLNEGFGGEGNALFRFDGAPDAAALAPWVRGRMAELAFEAPDMTLAEFSAKFRAMGGIVEAWVEGAAKRSPSAQFRIDPLGQVTAISTHDQLLGGATGQIFMGCRFPADPAYARDIQGLGMAAAQVLADQGVRGRVAIDFVSVPEGERFRHFAIEANIRKGGTTLPNQMLQLLLDGHYDPESSSYLTAAGQKVHYVATDNLISPAYRGLLPEDLTEISLAHGLHFNAAAGEGVAFHLIGALSEFGKLGLVAIGNSPERAQALFERTVAVLDNETAAR